MMNDMNWLKLIQLMLFKNSGLQLPRRATEQRLMARQFCPKIRAIHGRSVSDRSPRDPRANDLTMVSGSSPCQRMAEKAGEDRRRKWAPETA